MEKGYFWFFEKAHWTKEQVDAQPPLYLLGLRLIGDAVDEVRDREARQAEREARRGG